MPYSLEDLIDIDGYDPRYDDHTERDPLTPAEKAIFFVWKVRRFETVEERRATDAELEKMAAESFG